LILVSEFCLRIDRICTGPDQRRPFFLDLCFRIAELGCLAGSAGCIRLGIKK
jgi:hypothetical protein